MLLSLLWKTWHAVHARVFIPLYFMTKYYNHGQKSYDTILFVGLFQFTQAQPLPHPTNNVGRLYPEFFPSILQHCPKDFCPGL